MAICIYDNFVTLKRELWENGKLILDISQEFMQNIKNECEICFGLRVDRQFKAGAIYGDAAAIEVRYYYTPDYYEHLK